MGLFTRRLCRRGYYLFLQPIRLVVNLNRSEKAFSRDHGLRFGDTRCDVRDFFVLAQFENGMGQATRDFGWQILVRWFGPSFPATHSLFHHLDSVPSSPGHHHPLRVTRPSHSHFSPGKGKSPFYPATTPHIRTGRTGAIIPPTQPAHQHHCFFPLPFLKLQGLQKGRMQFKEFDAFPKVESGFVKRTGSGGILTLVVSAVLCILVMGEIKEYMTTRNDYRFLVDPLVNHRVNINLDITVAMPCDGKSPLSFAFIGSPQCPILLVMVLYPLTKTFLSLLITILRSLALSLDLRDIAEVQLHLSDKVQKIPTVRPHPFRQDDTIPKTTIRHDGLMSLPIHFFFFST